MSLSITLLNILEGKTDFGRGWVSPDGVFIDNNGITHFRSAQEYIWNHLNKSISSHDANYYLLERGWVRVNTNAIEAWDLKLSKDALIIFLSKFPRDAYVIGDFGGKTRNVNLGNTVGEILNSLNKE